MDDFIDTGLDLAAFKNGRCVAVATRAAGPLGEKFNEEIIQEWAEAGYEVRTMSRLEAVAAHLDALGAPVQGELFAVEGDRTCRS